jgi:hypothetical protein
MEASYALGLPIGIHGTNDIICSEYFLYQYYHVLVINDIFVLKYNERT